MITRVAGHTWGSRPMPSWNNTKRYSKEDIIDILQSQIKLSRRGCEELIDRHDRNKKLKGR